MLASLTTLAASNPVDHVVNHHYASGSLFGREGVWLWSSHMGTLVLSGLLTVAIISYAASRIKTGPSSIGTDRYLPRGGFAHMIEVICVYLRDNTISPLLGKRTNTFLPFLWTMFFFILINNLLGLVPFIDVLNLVDKAIGSHVFGGLIGATATQNLYVTAVLALIAALVVNFAGVRELGVGGYLHHLTAGTPWYLWPLMIPIEIMGTIIKPVALALRLFANMTAGHILVAVLLMFAVNGLGLVAKDGVVLKILGGSISLVSVIAAVAIYFLEIFVAFLQAFVFMFLTTVFISQLSHHDEHEHHDEAHGHEHAHA